MCKRYKRGSLIALSPLLGFVILSGCVQPDVVLIPAGTFAMGDHFNEGLQRELPVHDVTIQAFEMDKAEVTNIEYKLCVGSNVFEPPDDNGSDERSYYCGNVTYSNYPVVWVSWDDANTYCSWKGMRLPTERDGSMRSAEPLWGRGIPGEISSAG
jgi:formylglycine-generating enzyme required for sulfatase activity